MEKWIIAILLIILSLSYRTNSFNKLNLTSTASLQKIEVIRMVNHYNFIEKFVH